MLFHLTTSETWTAARAAGRYTPDGPFIHLSTEAQWPGARERFYRDVPDLLLLAIDDAKLTSEVRYEPADGDSFPHLYGPLNLDAVVSVTAL